MPLCTPTFHNLCCKSHVIGDSVLPLRNFRKTEKNPVILRPTRESNPRPLARQSHLQPLGQRGSQAVIFMPNLDQVIITKLGRIQFGHDVLDKITVLCLVSKLFDVCSKSTPEQMEQLEEIRIPWGSGIVGYVAESGEPVNIPDAYKPFCSLQGRYFCRLILRLNKMVSRDDYGLPSWPASKPLALPRLAVHAYSRIHCL
ncbi:hypothetical protein SFRURICE_005663 [Spodoptera frugiperda]|nr:hypothetical protein SFRURICE_005663 [Spodoptera frugiperda]